MAAHGRKHDPAGIAQIAIAGIACDSRAQHCLGFQEFPSVVQGSCLLQNLRRGGSRRLNPKFSL